MYVVVKRLAVLLLLIIMSSVAVWAYEDVRNGVTYNVVYVSASGAGNKSGNSVANAASGWQNAYNKLSSTGGTYEEDWAKNVIVVVGEIDLKIKDAMTNGGIAATITGVWPWNDDVTETEIKAGGKLKVSQSNSSGAGWMIGADTRFKNVVFKCGDGQGRLSLMMHNTLFDTGLVMTGWGDLTTENGAMQGRRAPDLHVIIMEDMRVTRTSPYELTEPVRVEIRSGRYGRVMSVRTTGTTTSAIADKYRIGSPNYPLLAKVVVDIAEGNFGNEYADDIAYLCAGSTQGAVFGDIEYDIRRGEIATFVAGTQGNAIKAATAIPASMFAGRVTINIDAEHNEDVVIQRYFGANQGRVTNGVTLCEASAYFYGQSILNLRGGTIENGIYVSSAGVSGLKSSDGAYHTWDPLIPYADGSNNVTFGPYNASKSMAVVKSRLNGAVENINIEETQAIINIFGGEVYNGVYGGSYGYSEEFAVGEKYKYMPQGAGTFFGNTMVNISGGLIHGGVYGGGKGTSEFYTRWTSDCAHNSREDFLTVATVYGSTNIKITGNPTIEGDIYGGGAGVASLAENDFLDVAKVYGQTNIEIDADAGWVFNGNIYGGGAYGSVMGNSNVVIHSGAINGMVFGGSKGEVGHVDKAKLEGNPHVEITTNCASHPGVAHAIEIGESVYGGGSAAPVEGNPEVEVNGADGVGQKVTIHKDVYGGGLGETAVVTGGTSVQVKGNTEVGNNVYGGGNGGVVTGSTQVVIGDSGC